MKRPISIAALLTVIAAVGSLSCSKEPEMAPGRQTTCPVMKNRAIDPDLHVDVDGKRIYVCCKGCIEQIKAEPAKYIKQLESNGIEL